jgi:hypothetical protein
MDSPSDDLRKRRYDLARRTILNSVCDDYESYEYILDQLDKFSVEFRVFFTQDEVLCALRDLLAEELIAAYVLTPDSAPSRFTAPSSGLSAHYYWITPSGMVLHQTPFEDWPFDQEGNPRVDWTCPV